MTELSAETVTELRSFLPVASSVSNPVDMIASASAEDYGRAIRVVAGDPGIDALIVIYIPPLEAAAAEVARQLVGAIADVDGRIPVAVVLHVRARSPRGAACAGHPDPFVPLSRTGGHRAGARRPVRHVARRAPRDTCRRSTTRSRGRPPR